MLVELTVENIAIVERAQITLGPGLTALTGETGAGKSLIVDALELALGARADTELVRQGATRALVGMTADLNDNAPAREKCAELGVDLEDGLLFVQRELSVEGRSTCRIAGRLAPLSTLRALGTLLVDLHGQHDHQSLLDAGRHLGYLDHWVGALAEEGRGRVAQAYARAQGLRSRLSDLRSGRREVEQRIDLLRYQIHEIEAVAPLEGELDDVQSRLARMQNAERLASAAATALGALADEEGAAWERIGTARKELEGALRIDSEVGQACEAIQAAEALLVDGVRALRAYAEGIDVSPDLLEETAARADALRRLRRKYGEDETAVLAVLESARQELESLGAEGSSEEELVAQLAGAEKALARVAGDLSTLRRAKALEFDQLVRGQLRDLAMNQAEFETRLAEQPPDATGADRVEFFFSANPGEAPRPLAKIASGGEISRVMLAIKVALAGKAGVPTLVFDEVDAGLGGRAAAVVGRKLQELARHAQVVTITHLPQIAGRAGSHFRIEKRVDAGRSQTIVRSLVPEERVDEIARMLGGEHVSESALANARDLLASSAPVS